MTEEELKRGLDDAYKKAGHNAFFSNGFMAGVEFMKSHLDKVKKKDQEMSDALQWVLDDDMSRGQILDKVSKALSKEI